MYNVAFVYTEEAGAYQGVVTWTSFGSKEEFDEWYDDEIKKEKRVVEEGVSDKRCIELSLQTPFSSRLAVMIEESIIPDTQEIDPQLLAMNLALQLVVPKPPQ
ncbi:MAG: hypothetical protein A2114_02080 [Candidatus Vogelbacteria bacterium GWA1_51_14]|uniref:Uncharacterized protein n=1 Tax=Candidatus Vogelbacteria bacterium GWA1_51_14 TaxID=1802435 RepID=A0A1G2QD49_9BACT|nr:MAG: hypothetical protein A2114_02080 [Candidatus Vogelbacteria bacterium GWA1_51_14]